MPPKVTKSILGDKVRATANKTKAMEVEYDANAGLPAGIQGGIAQLAEIKFDTYKSGKLEGQPYFYAAGVVKRVKTPPENYDESDLIGQRTQIGPIPVCDTDWKELDEQVQLVQNEIKKLLVEPGQKATKEHHDMVSGESIEDTVKLLKSRCEDTDDPGVFFKFRTWQRQKTEEYPNPRVNHVWNGLVEYEGGGDDPTAGTDDGSDEAPPPPKPKATAAKNGKPKEPEPEPEPEEAAEPAHGEDGFDEFIDGLAEQAEAGDDDAIAKLTELAIEAGQTQEWIDDEDDEGAKDWLEVAEFIKNPTSDEDADADATEWEPELGAAVVWTSNGKKKKCEVTFVDGDAKVCKLKDLATQKPVVGTNKKPLLVGWSELSDE